MAESQSHGFDIEASVKQSKMLCAAPPSLGYTAGDDVQPGYSAWPLGGGAPMQIKAAQAMRKRDPNGQADAGVMLADALRNHDRGAVELVVCVWEQEPAGKRALAYHRMAFQPGSWGTLFGTMTRAELATIDAEVKAIPKGLPKADYAELSKATRVKIAALRELHGAAIGIQPKISTSDGQRRIQCACSLSTLIAHADHHEAIGPSRFAEFELPGLHAGGARDRVKKTKKTSSSDGQQS